MARQAPQRGKPLLPLLALIVSATVVVAQDAIYPVTYVPATQSLRFGPGYMAFVNTATNPPSLTVVDSTGAPVAPISNADGSATVAGYTAYPNGTITGPGGLSIYIGAGDALVAMGTTTVLKNGTIVDGSGIKLVPSKNADGSYTAGDMTGWSNGTIVGSGGAVINAGAPLTLTADGSIAFAPRLATPAPGAAISLDPAARSLSFGGYTVTVSLSGDKLSLVDSTGKPVATTPNPDGSRSLGDYMLYRNGTIAAPGGIAIHTAGPNAGLRVGTTTVLINGTILDSMGAKIVPTGPNEDGSYSAGDVKGWANGTIIDTNTGVVFYAGAPLAVTADGRVTLASPSIPAGAAAPTAAAPSAGAAAPSAAAPSAAAPSAGAAAPSAAAPSAGAAAPSAAAPSAGAAAPSPGAAAPSAGAAAPSPGAAAPSSGAAAPSPGAAAPSSGAAAPSAGAAAPSPGAAAPSAGAAAPSSGAAAPSAGVASPPIDAASPPTDASPPPAGSTSPPAGSTSPPAGSTSPPAGASTPAAPPPPPKTAGLFASPATALTALITLALAPLMFM